MNSKVAKSKLTHFGLGEIEADIYLYLLGKNPKTILEISQALHTPRTSIYDNAHKLIEKGLVERIVQYNSQKLKAHPISILEDLIHKKQEELDNLSQDLEVLKESLVPQVAPTTETQVRYYHGVQGFQQMMYNNLEAEGEMFGYSQLGRQEIVGNKFMKKWNQEVIQKQLKDRVLVRPVPDTLKYIQRNHPLNLDRDQYETIRYLPADTLHIAGDFTLYNHIMAIQYWHQGELVGVEIENPELVKTQKSIFEILWSQAQPIEELL